MSLTFVLVMVVIMIIVYASSLISDENVKAKEKAERRRKDEEYEKQKNRRHQADPAYRHYLELSAHLTEKLKLRCSFQRSSQVPLEPVLYVVRFLSSHDILIITSFQLKKLLESKEMILRVPMIFGKFRKREDADRFVDGLVRFDF